jgi:hypothetical protein
MACDVRTSVYAFRGGGAGAYTTVCERQSSRIRWREIAVRRASQPISQNTVLVPCQKRGGSCMLHVHFSLSLFCGAPHTYAHVDLYALSLSPPDLTRYSDCVQRRRARTTKAL